MRVVPFCGGGRDLALQHESWKVVIIETHILCIEIYTLQPYIIDFTQRGCHTIRFTSQVKIFMNSNTEMQPIFIYLFIVLFSVVH